MSPIGKIQWMVGYHPRAKIHAVRTDTRWRYALCGKRDADSGDYAFDLAEIPVVKRVLATKEICARCLERAESLLSDLERREGDNND